jgi:hypothetical protein
VSRSNDTAPIRLEGAALFAALRSRDPDATCLEDLREVLDDGKKSDEQKVKKLAKMLGLRLVPLPHRPHWQTRKIALDKSSQWWKTLDVISAAIDSEEHRRRVSEWRADAPGQYEIGQIDDQGLAEIRSRDGDEGNVIEIEIHDPQSSRRSRAAKSRRKKDAVLGVLRAANDPQKLLPIKPEDEE